MKKKVAVLFGGKSPEYEVSLASGDEVVKNLDPKKYKVIPVQLPKTGNYLSLISKIKNVDVVFIAMHGPYGEDGTVQGMLELAGLKYTGSGVLASALGMDKSMFRKVLTAGNISIPKYIEVGRKYSLDGIYKKLGALPYFVKPNNQGSSVGSAIVMDEKGLLEALDEAFKYSSSVLIDQFIEGKELTCPILGNNDPYALPIIEIVPKKGDFFDYKSKYEDGGADEIVPARISVELTKKIQKIAVEVYKLVGCRGFGRVDFILNNNNDPICLEINTIPGLTPGSLFPKSIKATGMTYPEWLEK